MEIDEHVLLEQFGMQVGDAVDRVATHAGEMGHAHVALAAFVDQRHARDARVVAEEAHAGFVEETRVDLENDLEMSRQQPAEQPQRPALQRFGQQRRLV